MATPQNPSVNIAGDYSSRGVDIAPDDVAMGDFENEADELGEMQNIAPSQMMGGVTEKMKQTERETREKIKAGAKLVNPVTNADWPVDE